MTAIILQASIFILLREKDFFLITAALKRINCMCYLGDERIEDTRGQERRGGEMRGEEKTRQDREEARRG